VYPPMMFQLAAMAAAMKVITITCCEYWER
jgi:hypothetical protein